MKWTFAAGAVALTVLAGCATGSSPGASGARLDRALENQAAAFDGYARSTGELKTGYANAADVERALRVAAAYEPKSLESGMIAYAAAAAVQDKAFVAAVRKADKSRPGLARRIASRPEVAMEVQGARSAAARAGAALARRAEPIERAGASATKASYASQRQAWARAAVADPRGRLARVKAAGRTPARSDASHVYAETARAGGQARGAPSAVAVRATAVAALSVLGEGGRARSLLTEPRSGQCLRLAKLNLHQCLASAGPAYEDMYCLGRHGLTETAGCVETAARGAVRSAAR